MSYLSLNSQRYNIIAQRYLEYPPDAHTREQLAMFSDADLYKDNNTMVVDNLASVLFNVLLHITNVPAYTVTSRRSGFYGNNLGATDDRV